MCYYTLWSVYFLTSIMLVKNWQLSRIPFEAYPRVLGIYCSTSLVLQYLVETNIMQYFPGVIQSWRLNSQKKSSGLFKLQIKWKLIHLLTYSLTQLLNCPHNALVSHLKLCLRVPGFLCTCLGNPEGACWAEAGRDQEPDFITIKNIKQPDLNT